ncbi:MAG: hypothetical protein IKL06_03460 [Lachnospiraceae bacterium]|nr:hypothetical protein [Lachnospiraceae bacterium]
MKKIEKVLKNEVEQLKKIIGETEKRLRNAPSGNLRISNKKGKVEYYYRSKETDNRNGRYMKKREKDLVKRIVQRDYDNSIIKKAAERLKVIELFLEKYSQTDLNDVFQQTSLCRRELLEVAVLTDEEYIKRWSEVSYEGKNFKDDTQIIVTERGERVRSKSEKIIADKLYMLGIPYRYEYPIYLDSNIKIHPDFTILRMPEREEVYLEHFGLLDDAEYVEQMVWKLNMYEKNGIYLGVKLFITHETSANPLNMKALDGMVRELFCVK